MADMRHRLLASLAAAASLLAAVASPPAAAAETATIYQQRGANGRVVLTDRPQPLAVTERSWEIEREDPVAAQQRADAMRRNADAVSARVRRSIEQQQRVAESDREWAIDQARLAERERLVERARVEGLYDGGVVVAPYVGARRWWLDRPDGPRRSDSRGPGRDGRDSRLPADAPRRSGPPPPRLPGAAEER